MPRLKKTKHLGHFDFIIIQLVVPLAISTKKKWYPVSTRWLWTKKWPDKATFFLLKIIKTGTQLFRKKHTCREYAKMVSFSRSMGSRKKEQQQNIREISSKPHSTQSNLFGRLTPISMLASMWWNGCASDEQCHAILAPSSILVYDS